MPHRHRPCYRVCTWDRVRFRWRPHVTRTRKLLKTLRDLKRWGFSRHDIYVNLRPGKGVPLPMPEPPPTFKVFQA